MSATMPAYRFPFPHFHAGFIVIPDSGISAAVNDPIRLLFSHSPVSESKSATNRF
jgi:hypothetical protein